MLRKDSAGGPHRQMFAVDGTGVLDQIATIAAGYDNSQALRRGAGVGQ